MVDLPFSEAVFFFPYLSNPTYLLAVEFYCLLVTLYLHQGLPLLINQWSKPTYLVCGAGLQSLLRPQLFPQVIHLGERPFILLLFDFEPICMAGNG